MPFGSLEQRKGPLSPNTWCRRRDSNSHSFRHYPLKIACLPISPRRLRVPSHDSHSFCRGNPPRKPPWILTLNTPPRSFAHGLRHHARSRFGAHFGGSTCPVPVTADEGSGGAGTSVVEGVDTLAEAPGICAAGEGCAALAADAPTKAGRSRMLPVDTRERSLARYASSRVQQKKTVAQAAVERDRKLALPVAPNRLPDAPLPNEAPISAPLPCCTSTSPIMTSAESICTATTRLNRKLMKSNLQKTQAAACNDDRQIARNSAALRDAPPIKPPSISGCFIRSPARLAVTLPP